MIRPSVSFCTCSVSSAARVPFDCFPRSSAFSTRTTLGDQLGFFLHLRYTAPPPYNIFLEAGCAELIYCWSNSSPPKLKQQGSSLHGHVWCRPGRGCAACEYRVRESWTPTFQQPAEACCSCSSQPTHAASPAWDVSIHSATHSAIEQSIQAMDTLPHTNYPVLLGPVSLTHDNR